MLLECICRICLTKYENQNELFVISCENKLDIALASIFNIKVQPEFCHLYKICGPCAVKLMEFYDFYINTLKNEDKLLDIVFNEKLDPIPHQLIPIPNVTNDQIPAEKIVVSNEIEVEDVEMSNDTDNYDNSTSTKIYPNDSNSSNEKFECNDLSYINSSSTVDNDSNEDSGFNDFKPPKMAYLSEVASEQLLFDDSDNEEEKVQPMEVEQIKSPPSATRTKSKCDECGVYVFNVFQHKKCVHDYSSKQECTDCKAVFPNRLKLLMHRYYKHVPPRYKCEFCHKEVRTKNQLREHTYQKHYEGVYLYNCDHCDAQFNYRTSLVIHQKRLHPREYEKAKQHRIAMKYRP